MRTTWLAFVALFVLVACDTPDGGPDLVTQEEDALAASADSQVGGATDSVTDAPPGSDTGSGSDTAADTGPPPDDDWDDDGSPNDEDCEPLDESIHPGAVERCNALDDDCNGLTDDDVQPRDCEICNDHGCCPGTTVCEAGHEYCDGDTPLAEFCNGEDENCNDVVDENAGGQPCQNCNEFGCCFGTTFCVDGEEHCNAAVAALDVCDGIDNDCDGVTDDPHVETHCEDEYPESDGIYDCMDPDDDNDGWPDENDNCVCGYNPGQENVCDDDELGDMCDPDQDDDDVPNEYDCDPCNPNIYPGAPEICNGLDDNCDGYTDEGWNPCGFPGDPVNCMTLDHDEDGVRDRYDNCPCSYNPVGPDGQQANHDDDPRGDVCDNDDDNDTILDTGDGNDIIGDHPCPDGVTDDCDDNCQFVFNIDQTNSDDDDMGDACDPDDDNDDVPDLQDNCPLVHNPGQENDCDNDALGDACDDDMDNDGYVNQVDCDPCDADVFPGASEVCNGRDDDCDGQTDEADAAGCSLWFWDADGDGYGTNDHLCACGPIYDIPEGPFYRASESGDCDDEDRNVNPGQTEICCNDVDENCDGHLDEDPCIGCVTYYFDGDQDGWGIADEARCLPCGPEPPYSASQTGDCRDDVAEVHPAATEVCDGFDNNCDLLVDEEEFGGEMPCGVCGICINGVCVEEQCP